MRKVEVIWLNNFGSTYDTNKGDCNCLCERTYTALINARE